MRKSLKILLIVGITLISVIATLFVSYFIITGDAKLQPEKLIDYGKTINVYDDNGEKIENASYLSKQKSVNIENLSDNTVNAFIASEDRAFYKHRGLNYKRMLKALYRNAVSFSFKEGASTISQQLIKNTHLNNDKTITRKLKEIKLTKQLERRYDKDKILEMYLNTIYFGHSCYGLQNAAHFYFNKPAEQLDLEQSATVAGILSSPNNYSPFNNPELCLKRRNLVLNSMNECGFIDETTLKKTVEKPLSASKNTQKRDGSYINAVFEELEKTGIDPYGQFTELNIRTYFDGRIQDEINRQSAKSDLSIFVRTNDGGICGYTSSIGSAKRQIGSTAKPIFVYAPALEEKKIHLFTKINDEKINYNGYSPENYDKKYHGKVTVADSIKYSYNVPAVKTLNSLDIKSVAKYAEKMNVNLCDDDKNLSLALGGMKDGLSLKELTDCYSVFPNGGIYKNSSFIKEITDQNGKVLYQNGQIGQKVYSEGTCSLINGILCETAKTGTAKKLKSLNFDVACKTGTCGNAEGNTDAYSICYTSEYSIGVWQGDKNNERSQITGGSDCCGISENILKRIYEDKNCPTLEKITGTTEICIDREEYENNDKIILCDDNSPKLNKLTVRCLNANLPKEKSTRFTSPKIQTPTLNVNYNTVCVSLYQTKYYSYIVKRLNNGNIDVIYDGEWKKDICDSPVSGTYTYTVTPYYKCENSSFYGKEITLPQVKISGNSGTQKIPGIVYKDWFNQ